MESNANSSIILTGDGTTTVVHSDLTASYHSIHGAVQESNHVFIEAGLSFVHASGKQKLNVLEFGFGSGLNALLSFKFAQKHGLTLNYQGIDNLPLSIEQAKLLHFGKDIEQTAILNLHRSTWNQLQSFSPLISYIKVLSNFESVLLQPKFDLVYYDAFSPNIQAALWQPPMLKKVYDALVPTGILVTYCAQGAFKRGLTELGFKVESLKGPPGKREMTRAIKEEFVSTKI